MSNKRDASVDTSDDDISMKSKLSSIWSELQTNLPTISFDDVDEVDISENDEQHEIVLDEKYMNDDDNYNNDEIIDFEKEFKNFNNKNETLIKSEELYSKLETQNKVFNMNKNVIASTELATKITKNLFDSSNTKLNMDIFDQIDFDEIMESINTDNTDNTSNVKNLTISDNKVILNKLKDNDDKILEKLKAFSMQQMSEAKPKLDNNQSKNKLKSIKYNNEPSGNIIETKRIDLRHSTSQNLKPKQNCFNAMLEELNIMEFNMNPQMFMNNVSSSDSGDSDDCDTDDNNGLWIERYRLQRQSSKVANLIN